VAKQQVVWKGEKRETWVFEGCEYAEGKIDLLNAPDPEGVWEEEGHLEMVRQRVN